MPTEKKRSELNGVIAFVRGRRSPLGALKCLSVRLKTVIWEGITKKKRKRNV